ncbi:MAG TPA: SH3 domain-containing protein [Chloroflexia bacterium]|nr:SH3 domain-containing protein [Chloroflexia bacterium]
MIPAKSRERKCSTCKHYQASPLWRKGWCRNPLLYDRNTNHLVEADSLACNRTFIDYWEPLDERAATQGGQPRSTGTTGPKPRIAPSIPLDTVDAAGAPVASREQTPAMGSAMPARSRKPMFRPLSGREPARPPLSLVDEEYDELEPADPKATAKMPQVDRQKPGGVTLSAKERIQQARSLRRPNLPQLSGPRLWIALGGAGLLILVVAAVLLLGRRGETVNPPPSSSIIEKTTVLPSPTGLGDARPSPTVVVPTVSVVVPTGKIAVNGYARVVNTGDGLVIRQSPARAGTRVTKVPDGTRLHIIDGPEEADGFTWWKVDGFNPQSPDTAGWCVQTYLSPTTAP